MFKKHLAKKYLEYNPHEHCGVQGIITFIRESEPLKICAESDLIAVSSISILSIYIIWTHD